MLRISSKLILMVVAGLVFVSAAAAQGTGNNSPFGKDDDKNEGPYGAREMLKKLEIEKEKKDFEEMKSRGDKALELSNELEKATVASNQLSEKEKAKLVTLEKLVKKIRSDLGGSDSDADNDDDTAAKVKPTNVAEGIKDLKSATLKLVEELKKTSRFTVSVTAIQTTNSVLRIARFLKFWT